MVGFRFLGRLAQEPAARATDRRHPLRLGAYIIGFRLGQLRHEAGLGRELAAQMNVTQARISQLENGDLDQLELEFDTLRRCVAALGDRLRLVADIDDRDVTVSSTEINRDATA